VTVVLAGCGGDGSAQDTTADIAAINAAIDSGQRLEEARARDAGRKPLGVLSLSGIRIGDHVIELGSFGQYYSALLSTIVGPEGKLDMFDPTFVDFGAAAARTFVYDRPNSEFHLVDYAEAEFPSDVDIVFNILFYHDLMSGGIDTAALNAKVFAALKPGGAYLVVDHKAADGAGWRDAGTLHRIDAETIIDEVTAAGFELEVDSDILANPDDPRTGNVFGMRGETDRAVLLFRKPD
jgi:predicted methyltransferase